MTEVKELLARLRAVHGGNRAVITKLIKEARGHLKEETPDRGRLNTIVKLLEEKSKQVSEPDKKIIEICEVNDIFKDIEDFGHTTTHEREIKL